MSAVLLDHAVGDPMPWKCRTDLRKWHTDDDTAHLWTPADELETVEGNLLVYGGASLLWQYAIGNGVVTAGQQLTYLNAAQSAIGVGDSATAQAASQTNLQAATNRLRKAMDSTYPLHTDPGAGAPAVGNASIVYRSSFLTAEANWVWNEWGLFNSTTDATGRMLNRKVQPLGTKTSGTWQLTVTLTLA